jgi:hypothetical protein
MKISANMPIISRQESISKSKESGEVISDQVVLGANKTDNTLSMGEHLKNLKSYNEFSAYLDLVKDLMGIVIGGVVGAGICATGGSLIASALGASGALKALVAIPLGVIGLAGGGIGGLAMSSDWSKPQYGENNYVKENKLTINPGTTTTPCKP